MQVMPFLLGSAWGVLCHQRGLLPLHCSSVSLQGNAFAFVADSGGGKSTLAASLCHGDVRHVCDDVSIASIVDDHVSIYAMPKGLKLWREASDALSLGRERLAVHDQDREKYYVTPPEGPDISILQLAGIYDLRFSEDNSTTSVEALSGIEALKVVYQNIYRVEWVDTMRIAERVLAQAHKIAARVPVYRFTRPKNFDFLKDSSNYLAKDIESKARGAL